MTAGRNDHTASLLPNGQVLLAGGFENGPGDRASLEVFDPVTSAWIAITNTLNSARSHHTATILAGGRILVTGGMSPNGVTNSTELYDYANGTWTNTGALGTARYSHTATLLSNGKVLAAGGNRDGTLLSNAELYDPITRTWTNTTPLNTPRSQHTATLLPDGKVLAAGGVGLSSAELYDPAGGVSVQLPAWNCTIQPRECGP